MSSWLPLKAAPRRARPAPLTTRRCRAPSECPDHSARLQRPAATLRRPPVAHGPRIGTRCQGRATKGANLLGDHDRAAVDLAALSLLAGQRNRRPVTLVVRCVVGLGSGPIATKPPPPLPPPPLPAQKPVVRPGQSGLPPVPGIGLVKAVHSS